MQWASIKRESLKEQWANGNFGASFEAEFIARTSAAGGACSILAELLELDYNKLIMELSDE